MRIAGVEMMREIDRIAVEEIGIPAPVLMENAALACIRNLDLTKGYFVVVCGRGNNGGDGFAIARHLYCMDKEVDVFYISEGSDYKTETRTNFRILKRLGVPMIPLSSETMWSFREALKDADVVIDSLVGTGVAKPLRDFLRQVIQEININSKYVLSVDVPSGMNADNGETMGQVIDADMTVTFQCMKRGFLNYDAMSKLGRVIVENIGIPGPVEAKAEKGEFLTDHALARSLVPLRDKTGFKSNYGKVLVVAGSSGFTGAALICTEAAISTGSGLVTLCSREEVFQSLVLRLKEAMSIHPDDLEDGTGRADVVVFGPGLGAGDVTFDMLLRVIKSMQENGGRSKTLLLDADGLNVLKDRTEILTHLDFNVILTPHVGEMSRLCGLSSEVIQKNRIDTARSFAQEHKCIVVLKGYNTVITDGKTAYVNPTGSSAMAQGGMGDALAGIIGSLCGQGLEPLEAAILGTYLHGYIGDELAGENYIVKASEIIEAIPGCMKRLQDSKR
ncbi:NAD(P)H-hydrate dehydratase [Youngiibacter multivorans]|uniref:Bifunctional NAD(P)H-hydrate repair enzyme n=1 Tax=Youngiibacter multivorans TaxID=937251 RepID=A0ABS4G556_9CLOT|nr:NAD(P)H-hydrate dehydratase [Youngiibacter multivorans]MBP1919692.1 NAD(P)H-hydrate epimerase [Youngiibacter multivorans]